MIDPICPPPSLDQLVFMPLTSYTFDPEAFKPFLCELMNLAGIDNVDPIEIDFNTVKLEDTLLNFSLLTAVGDPRVSLGKVLSSVFYTYYPIALAQVEVLRSGGCQIIEDYICDSQGVQIKKMEVYCPPNFKMQPVQAEQVVKSTETFIKAELEKHAEEIIKYVLEMREKGYTDSLHIYSAFPLFYIKLTKTEEDGTVTTIYRRYYNDTRDYIASRLKRPIQTRSEFPATFDNEDHYKAMIQEL